MIYDLLSTYQLGSSTWQDYDTSGSLYYQFVGLADVIVRWW